MDPDFYKYRVYAYSGRANQCVYLDHYVVLEEDNYILVFCNM
jgi:hypothetical protein